MSALLEVQKLQISIRDDYGRTTETEASAEWNKLLSWLGSSIDNETILRKSLAMRSNGTGQWLLEHPTFKDWSNMDNSANLLWLNGAG
jgi:hypothetical protein